MALAGFKKEDVIVEVNDNTLTVSGKLHKEEDSFVHKGIARRAFEDS